MLLFVPVFGLVLAMLVTGSAIFARRASISVRGILWGLWSAGAIAALAGIVANGYVAARLFMSGWSASLTGLERLAGLQVLCIVGVAAAIVGASFFIVRRRLGTSVYRRVIGAGVGIGCLAILMPASLVEWLRVENLREAWTIFVRDEDNQPIAGAMVSWKIYGYGPGGTRPHEPAEVGRPIKTDAGGRGVVHGWSGRHEMLGTIERPGFVSVEFRVGMAFESDAKFRSFGLRPAPRMLEKNSGQISTTGPVEFVVFMSSERTFQSPVEIQRSAWRLYPGESRARPLTLWRSSSGRDQQVRAWLENTPDQWGNNHWTCSFDGGDGLSFLLVERYPQNAPARALPEDFLPVAPLTGYKSSIALDPSNGGWVDLFAKSQDGTYARMGVSFQKTPTRRQPDQGVVETMVFWNTSGERGLFRENPSYEQPSVQ